MDLKTATAPDFELKSGSPFINAYCSRHLWNVAPTYAGRPSRKHNAKDRIREVHILSLLNARLIVSSRVGICDGLHNRDELILHVARDTHECLDHAERRMISHHRNELPGLR